MKPSRTSRPTALLSGKTSLALVIRNAGWLLAGKAFGAILSLVYIAIVTRTLGIDQFGQFTLILGLGQAIVAFMSFQSWQLVIRFGHQSLVNGDDLAIGKLLGFCMTIDIIGAIIGCALAALMVALFADFFGWSSQVAIAALALAVISLLSIRSTAQGILRLHDRYRDSALAASVTPLIRFIGAIIAFIWLPTLVGFLLAWMVAEVITAVAHWALARQSAGSMVQHTRFSTLKSAGVQNKGLYSFAVTTNIGATLTAASQHLPLLALGFFTGPAAAGLFRLSYQLSQALTRVSEIMSRSLFAEFSKLYAGTDDSAQRTLSNQARYITWAAGLIVIALTAAIGRPALGLIAGEEYLAAYPVLVILAIAVAIEMASVRFEPELLARGAAIPVLWCRAAAAVVMIIGLILLLPPYGGEGAAAAVLIYATCSYALLAIITQSERGRAI